MTDIPKRIRALRLLRLVFLVYFIVSILSLASAAIASGLAGSETIPDGVGITIALLTSIFSIARLVGMVVFAVILIITMVVNKQCLAAFWLGFAAALMAIFSVLLEYSLESRIPANVLSMLAGFCIAASVFELIEGIYDKQERKSPLFGFVCVALGLMVISTVLDFIVFIVKMDGIVATSIYLVGEVGFIVSYGIIYGCLQMSYKEVKKMKLESEVAINEAQ